MAEVSFGEWLKRRRRGIGLTQQQLAARINYSTVALKKIEAEERRPSPEVVERLAEVFNIPVEERIQFLRFARGDWQSAPASAAEDTPWRNLHRFPRSNLPIPLTSFIGREKEIDAVCHLLASSRIVTLTGPGGVGKTRLAIQSSNKLLDTFPHGVWWVELAPLTDDSLLMQAIARTLGVREVPGQALDQTLIAFLYPKTLLLVLDNCEHMILACAQIADYLLRTCPTIKILATSRETLGLPGEQTWSVNRLSLPDLQRISLIDLVMQYEGIRLFVERSHTANSDFSLTERNLPAVTQICQRLDGMPLAIELAAARVKMMSADEIAERLDDRFALLTAGSRTAMPRHQTLRATIDWSYDLLSRPERIFFTRLAVFTGGFTLEAAEYVTAGEKTPKSKVPELLGQLINKSLVVAMPSEFYDVETRYNMLETIREYAYERLNKSGESEHVRRRHRDFFIALAEQAEPLLKSAQQFEWLDRLQVEQDNLRAAWDCAIQSDAALALRFVSALLNFWFIRGNPSEGRTWATQLLERTDQWGQTPEHAHVLGLAGRLISFQQDHDAAGPLLEQALDTARKTGDKKEIAFVLLGMGGVYAEECLTICQELQDKWMIAWAMFRLGIFISHGGHYAEVEELFMNSLATFKELGDEFRVRMMLNALGELMRSKGDYERASEYFESNIEFLREHHGRSALASALFNLAWVSLHRGEARKARTLFEESFNLYQEDGNKKARIECVAGLAAVLVMLGKAKHAARLFGTVEALLGGIAGHVDPPDQKELDHYIAAVRSQLDEVSFVNAWVQGQAMTLEQAITYALEQGESS